MWNSTLLNVISKGASTERPGSLGRLAATRAITQSQFWTPLWLAEACWKIINHNTDSNKRYRVLDNSMGSGRLLSFATPEQWEVCGLDTDETLISSAQTLLNEAGFVYDVCAGSMANVTNLPAVSIAVINPPFSITLQSPHLTPYDGITTYGPFGPHTSALSHDYALAQACSVADAVLAIVPATLADKVRSGLVAKTHSLIADLQLPANTFKTEGVNSVDTRLIILSNRQSSHIPAVTEFSQLGLDTIKFEVSTTEQLRLKGKKSSIEFAGVKDQGPVITLPVTGSKRVRLYQKRSTIGLRFECGLTQAVCLNALFKSALNSDLNHRYPSHIRFDGYGRVNINAHLLDADPVSSIQKEVCAVLENSMTGVLVEIDDQLVNYISRRAKQEAIACTPFRKFIRKSGQSTALVQKPGLANPKDWKGPIIKKGELLELVAGNKTEYAINYPAGAYDVDLDYLSKMAEVTIKQADDWELLHPGRLIEFPAAAQLQISKAKALGLNEHLWDFQLNDVVELTMSHTGAGYAADMGLGKSRMGLALCAMGGERNLLVVKSKLISEMLLEGKKIGFDSSINLITPANFSSAHLKKINLVSYETLRRQVRVRGKNVLLASTLKHKFHSVCCDEGSLLGNSTSLRSMAIRQLQAKKVFAFDGVMVDYPRNLLPIACIVAGESVPSQPYSVHREKLEAWQARGSKHTVRGAQAFSDDFVTLEWAVNEFKDGLEEGAKREIPKIKNVPLYRSWCDNFVKRRVRQEPEVKKHITINEAIYNAPEIIEWDAPHWSHYYAVATEFASWFSNHQRKQNDNQKRINLVAVLAEIEAVNRAANAPHIRNEESKSAWKHTYSPLTSKQRWTIAKVRALIAAGRKPLVFAQSPDVLQRLGIELTNAGLKPMLFTGKQTISQRVHELTEFRAKPDSVDVMLVSYGCGMDGLNLPQFDSVILYNGSWSYRTISQAVARLLRPEQQQQVEVHQAHLRGSIDEYQAQIQSFKKNAMSSGIDYQEQDQSDFLHLDHIFYQFVEDLKTKEAA